MLSNFLGPPLSQSTILLKQVQEILQYIHEHPEWIQTGKSLHEQKK